MAKNQSRPAEQLTLEEPKQQPADPIIPFSMAPDARVHANGRIIPLQVMARVTPDGLVVISAKRM